MNPWTGPLHMGRGRPVDLFLSRADPFRVFLPKRYETQGQLTRPLTGTYIYLPISSTPGWQGKVTEAEAEAQAAPVGPMVQWHARQNR